MANILLALLKEYNCMPCLDVGPSKMWTANYLLNANYLFNFVRNSSYFHEKNHACLYFAAIDPLKKVLHIFAICIC